MPYRWILRKKLRTHRMNYKSGMIMYGTDLHTKEKKEEVEIYDSEGM